MFALSFKFHQSSYITLVGTTMGSNKEQFKKKDKNTAEKERVREIKSKEKKGKNKKSRMYYTRRRFY